MDKAKCEVVVTWACPHDMSMVSHSQLTPNMEVPKRLAFLLCNHVVSAHASTHYTAKTG